MSRRTPSPRTGPSFLRHPVVITISVVVLLLAAAFAARSFPQPFRTGFTLRVPDADREAVLGRLATGPGVEARLTDRDAGLIEVECESSTAERARERCEEVLERAIDSTAAAAAEPPDSLPPTPPSSSDRAASAARLAALRDSLQDVVATEENLPVSRRQASARAAQAENRIAILSSRAATLDDLLSRMEWVPTGGRPYPPLPDFPGWVRQGSIPAMEQEVEVLMGRRNTLAANRSPNNPDIVAIDRRIQLARGELESALTARARAIDAEISALQSERAEARRLATDTSSTAALSARRERLTTEITRLEEAQAAPRAGLSEPEESSVETVELVASPTPVSRPVTADQVLLVLAGGLAGLALGLALAARADRRDEHETEGTIDSRQIRLPAGLSVMTILPAIRDPGPAFEFRSPDASGLVPRDPWETIGTATIQRRLERLAEEIRDGGIIAITSAEEGEGRTFVTCNLALASAAIGIRTLLVEADQGPGGVAAFFGSPSAARDQPTIELQVEGTGQLHILPARKRFLKGGTSLRNAEFLAFVRSAAERFELVLLDAPAADSKDDAEAIAAVAEAVLVVMGSNDTDQPALHLAANRLNESGARLLGAILNGPIRT